MVESRISNYWAVGGSSTSHSFLWLRLARGPNDVIRKIKKTLNNIHTTTKLPNYKYIYFFDSQTKTKELPNFARFARA